MTAISNSEFDNNYSKNPSTGDKDTKLDNINKKMYRGSYMSAHALFNLLNELGKRDKMRGLPTNVHNDLSTSVYLDLFASHV